MSGVKGKSGRKRKPLALHILEHTYRPDRHGPRPVTAGATAVAPSISVPAVPQAVIAGLAEPGLSFVLDTWGEYGEWSPAALVLLRQAGQTIDALAGYQAQIAADGALLTTSRGSRLAHPLLRTQHQARATLLALLAALNLKEK